MLVQYYWRSNVNLLHIMCIFITTLDLWRVRYSTPEGIDGYILSSIYTELHFALYTFQIKKYSRKGPHFGLQVGWTEVYYFEKLNNPYL